MKPSTDALKSTLMKWASKHLDPDIFGGQPPEREAAAAQTAVIMSERPAFILRHRDQLQVHITIETQGFEFVVYAPHAMQTSPLMQARVAARRRLRMLPGARIFFEWNDENPFVVDRIVDFWTNGALNVQQTKLVTLSSGIPVDDEDQAYYMDQTDKISTVEVLLLIYSKAIKLHDSPMEAAAVLALRTHLHSSELGHIELLNGCALVYGRDPFGPFIRNEEKVRPMLLAALVKWNSAMLLSEEADLYMEFLRRPGNEQLAKDLALGVAFVNENSGSSILKTE